MNCKYQIIKSTNKEDNSITLQFYLMATITIFAQFPVEFSSISWKNCSSFQSSLQLKHFSNLISKTLISKQSHNKTMRAPPQIWLQDK